MLTRFKTPSDERNFKQYLDEIAHRAHRFPHCLCQFIRLSKIDEECKIAVHSYIMGTTDSLVVSFAIDNRDKFGFNELQVESLKEKIKLLNNKNLNSADTLSL